MGIFNDFLDVLAYLEVTVFVHWVIEQSSTSLEHLKGHAKICFRPFVRTISCDFFCKPLICFLRARICDMYSGGRPLTSCVPDLVLARRSWTPSKFKILVIWFRIHVSGKFWTHAIGFSQFSKTISIETTSAANRPLQHLLHSLKHCPSFRACSNCKTIFTQESLLEFEPMIGFGKYNRWIQTPNNSGIFSITNTHDLCWSAYSRWGNHNLPNEGNFGSGHAQ